MNKPASFTETITQMWETRPPRIPCDQGGNAKIAGVCEGIGVRYQIDPTLVRVMFVVTTLAVGGGITAYLLAWICMPRYGLSVSPIQAAIRPKSTLNHIERKEISTAWWLLVFLIMSSGFVSVRVDDIWVGSSTMLAVALILVAWYGLHQMSPTPPVGLIAPPHNGKAEASGTAGTNPFDEQAAPNVNLSGFTPADPTFAPPTPPSWDPLGTAPFAWDLPEPPPHAPQHPKSSLWKWILIGFSIAAAVLVALAAIGLAVSAVVSQWTSATSPDYRYITEISELEGSVNTDQTATIIDMSFMEPATSATDVTLSATEHPLEVVLPEQTPVRVVCDTNPGSTCSPGNFNEDADGALVTLTIVDGSDHDRVTVTEADPSTDDSVNNDDPIVDDYDGLIGKQTIDLTQLDALSEPQTITVDHGIGSVTVLPPSGPYIARCETLIGSTTCPGVVQNANAEGELLTIEIDNIIGNVVVDAN